MDSNILTMNSPSKKEGIIIHENILLSSHSVVDTSNDNDLDNAFEREQQEIDESVYVPDSDEESVEITIKEEIVTPPPDVIIPFLNDDLPTQATEARITPVPINKLLENPNETLNDVSNTAVSITGTVLIAEQDTYINQSYVNPGNDSQNVDHLSELAQLLQAKTTIPDDKGSCNEIESEMNLGNWTLTTDSSKDNDDNRAEKHTGLNDISANQTPPQEPPQIPKFNHNNSVEVKRLHQKSKDETLTNVPQSMTAIANLFRPYSQQNNTPIQHTTEADNPYNIGDIINKSIEKFHQEPPKKLNNMSTVSQHMSCERGGVTLTGYTARDPRRFIQITNHTVRPNYNDPRLNFQRFIHNNTIPNVSTPTIPYYSNTHSNLLGNKNHSLLQPNQNNVQQIKEPPKKRGRPIGVKNKRHQTMVTKNVATVAQSTYNEASLHQRAVNENFYKLASKYHAKLAEAQNSGQPTVNSSQIFYQSNAPQTPQYIIEIKHAAFQNTSTQHFTVNNNIGVPFTSAQTGQEQRAPNQNVIYPTATAFQNDTDIRNPQSAQMQLFAGYPSVNSNNLNTNPCTQTSGNQIQQQSYAKPACPQFSTNANRYVHLSINRPTSTQNRATNQQTHNHVVWTPPTQHSCAQQVSASVSIDDSRKRVHTQATKNKNNQAKQPINSMPNTSIQSSCSRNCAQLPELNVRETCRTAQRMEPRFMDTTAASQCHTTSSNDMPDVSTLYTCSGNCAQHQTVPNVKESNVFAQGNAQTMEPGFIHSTDALQHQNTATSGVTSVQTNCSCKYAENQPISNANGTRILDPRLQKPNANDAAVNQQNSSQSSLNHKVFNNKETNVANQKQTSTGHHCCQKQQKLVTYSSSSDSSSSSDDTSSSDSYDEAFQRNNKENAKAKQDSAQVENAKLALEEEILNELTSVFCRLKSSLANSCDLINKFNTNLCKSAGALIEIGDVIVNHNDSLKVNNEKESDDTQKQESRKREYAAEKVESTLPNWKSLLPPEYNPRDSKWTLKYRKRGPGLIELKPHSGVYVNAEELANCKAKSNNCTILARKLLPLVFSEDALAICSLTGKKAQTFKGKLEDVRPGLDKSAMMVLLLYVEEQAIINKWGKFDCRNVRIGLGNRIVKIRKKQRTTIT